MTEITNPLIIRLKSEIARKEHGRDDLTIGYLNGLKNSLTWVEQFNKEYLKQYIEKILQEYTNRIVENAKTMPICGKNHEACNMPYCDTCSEVVDKESITSQLPKFLKEIGI